MSYCPIAKRSPSQLAKDAQGFIDSVRAFGSPNQAHKAIQDEKARQEEVSSTRDSNLAQIFKPTFEQPKPNHPSSPRFWPKLKLNSFRAEAITLIEKFYFTNKRLPVKADFDALSKLPGYPVGPAEWEAFLLEIQEPLQARGIPAYETPLSYLEPNFVLAVNLIVNAYDKRNVPAKLKEAGLSTKQWQGFLRQEAYQEYYKKRLDAIFDDDMQAEAKLAIMRLIQANDLQAVKYYNELQNIYRPQDNNNMQVILMAIMEILTLHVSPEIIGKVAESLRQSPQLKAIEV